MKDLCKNCAYAYKYKSNRIGECVTGNPVYYRKCHCVKANNVYNKHGWRNWMKIKQGQKACKFFMMKTGESIL